MSPRAAWRLEALGFTAVFWYAGGKADWGAAGLRLEGRFAASRHALDMARDVPTCQADDRIGDVGRRVQAAGSNTCFVLSDGGVVIGRLHETELGADADTRAGQVMREGPRTFRPDVGIDELLHYLRDHDLNTAPITTNDGRLIGLVHRRDLEASEHQNETSEERASPR